MQTLAIFAFVSCKQLPGPGASGKVGALDDNVWRVLLGEGLLTTSLRFSELSADKSAASISVRRTGIWIW